MGTSARSGREKVLGRALVLASSLLLGGATITAASVSAASQEIVRQELRSLCQRATSGDNPFFGEASVLRARRSLEGAADAPAERRIRLRGYLASLLIRRDRIPEAVELLETALVEISESAAELEPKEEKDLRVTALRVLALAHSLLAEDRNCIESHAAGSCILPFSEDALHRQPGGARRAGDLYLRLLGLDPEPRLADQARWLLNLNRMLSDDYPGGVPEALRLPPGALDSPAELPRFRNVAPALGLAVVDLSGGAVMEDFDGDGLLDLISSTWDPCGPIRAFRNDGEGGFVDVTETWGLDVQLGAFNLAQADYDGDGMVDLLALRGGWMGEHGRFRNSLLRNDLRREAGRFVDVTAPAGLAYPAYPTQAGTWGDYDGDGDLDLYVGNESPESTVTPQSFTSRGGGAYPSQLFRNDGDGTFTDVARAAGVTNDRFAKAAAWGDYDDDGDLDLYVSNIGPNRLYRNDGAGTFTDVAPGLGVDEPSAQSFGTWFFDYDNDGDLDLWVNRYGARIHQVTSSLLGRPVSGGGPVLFRNEGGRFSDVSKEVGLDEPSLPMGTNYGDLDNDGWLDAYLGTGVPDPEALMPNVMYRNDRGRRFEDATYSGGFGHLQKGHGIAFGDLDNDGDQDLFEQMGGAFPFDGFGNVLYENPTSDDHPERAWIVLRLRGAEANRFGVGARIEIRTRRGEESRSIHALAGSGASFGASSLQQEIGLGDAESIERITIRWPGSGTVQRFLDVEPNRYYLVREGAEALERLDPPRIRLDGGAGARGAPDANSHDHAKHSDHPDEGS